MTPEEQIARSICRALFYYDHGMRRLWPKYRYRAEQFCAKAIERDRRETRAAARAEAFEEAAEIAKTYRERYQSQGDAEADIAAVMAEEIEAAIRENAKGE